MRMEKPSLRALIERRQTGKQASPARIYDAASTALYRSKWAALRPAHGPNSYASACGSVFNIGFSPTDSIAVAVCASGAFTTHDPRRRSAGVHVVTCAHDEGANCVTFLGDHAFTTCSDDTTIKLWDLRNLRACVAVLGGHRGWVKNLEYDAVSGLLFSVAFDDGVRVWDIRRPELYGREANNLVIPLEDPVRLRIAPDSSKMFVSLRYNRCLVVDHFDGEALREASNDISKLVAEPRSYGGERRGRRRGTLANLPSLHVLSAIEERSGFRSVMSACFHPASGFIALRHIDVRGRDINCEQLSLYDLRSLPSEPSVVQDESRYLKHTLEFSDEDSVDIIKEIHFSRDGKVLASPHRSGTRLLSLDDDCTPAEVYFDDRYRCLAPPRPECSPSTLAMEVVRELSEGHGAPVLTCRFAHHDMVLASGCFGGTVCFHHPQL